jgi:hypothetical protein
VTEYDVVVVLVMIIIVMFIIIIVAAAIGLGSHPYFPVIVLCRGSNS